ncbi:outer membrane protein assembly factor BamC [Vibrio sp. SCSIO 43136]|uniref:outer membrane protein assembly factor BamC n=1 Tax=Vibrio sp. SCSIO 43136 TaxID=2819101 RepID=UPI0020758D1B|nr:outer membrane protein assembly factor BamC [Vibrio sp. SCSIO 43136]USD65948.1 outer membrane protein assembly factor BamC [Vibrio sp. SCSIO 43136]
MKFSTQLVTSALAVFVLSACSSDPSDRRQARDDFDYLDTPPLKELALPSDATPQVYPDYQIPAGEFTGEIGPNVDIRPPQQILDLIPGARSEFNDGEVTLWLVKQEEADKVWQTTLDMLAAREITLRENSANRVETDWVTWTSNDENAEIGSRYAIERYEANRRYGFKMTLIDWRENGVVKPVSETNKSRYNVLMTNLVMSTYDENLREEARLKAQELVKHIPITMGKDRSGLPVIIARAPYDVVWQQLPELLPQMGFELEERNQSQGVVKAKYAEPNDEFWQTVGVKPFDLKGTNYTFLIGDLNNRTSINITDSSDKPVTEEVLNSLVPVLAKLAETKGK